MTTIVGVLDRDVQGANTDILVRVDPQARLLEWVPRDLWCAGIADRINRAWALGGAAGLLAALAEHGLEADRSLIVPRSAAESCLARVDVQLPVDRPQAFWYPLAPTEPIEDGRRRVAFEPPSVRLRGERVHQWIGARYRVDGAGSDLERIDRQQALLRALLRRRFDFGPAFGGGLSPAAAADLCRVGADWQMATLGGLRSTRAGGKDVLVRGERR